MVINVGALKSRDYELVEHDIASVATAETAAVLKSAREAAADLRGKAEQTASRLVSEAQDEAEAREDASMM